MKYLFVGDVHNHHYIFNDIDRLDKEYNFDRIVFIGDYVDDWNTTNHESLKTLNKVLELKNEDKEKYTLLLGNHELSYLGYPCSGHRFELEDLITSKLKENINCFDLATSVNCEGNIYICSHAGFNNEFIKELYPEDYNETNFYYTMVGFNKDKLNNLEPFTYCSYLRGGHHEFSSSMWCDRREHKYFSKLKQYIPNQIVGHTPVKTIILENGIYFIDTHSTYQDGTEFGNKSYLMWNEDKFEITY